MNYPQNLEAYCRTCTDLQLDNIIIMEEKRIKDHNNEGEVAETAKIMLYEAQKEKDRRFH